MHTNPRIAVSLPAAEQTDLYLSFRLKPAMYVEQSEYRRPEKIFVVSDIEGNFRSLCRLLMRAKVVDKHLKWIFQDNHLVILGDCFDRGEQVTECLWLIYSLEERAKRKGGHVHFILGNHEIMNMNGDWRYVHPRYAERKKGATTALYDGNNELWRWLCTKNIIEKVGSLLFVHGGIANELLQPGMSVAEINRLARLYYTKAQEAVGDYRASLLYGSQTSPFWYRGYYTGTASQQQINTTLEFFDVDTILTGHTPVGQIDSYFSGKVINVHADHASAHSEGLLICEDQFYRLSIDGKKEMIK